MKVTSTIFQQRQRRQKVELKAFVSYSNFPASVVAAILRAEKVILVEEIIVIVIVTIIAIILKCSYD